MATNKNELPSQTTPFFNDDELDSEAVAFLERMNAAYMNMETRNYKLIELYEAGEMDALEAEIEEIVDSIAEESPEITELLSELKYLRSFNNQTEKDKERSAEIIENIKRLRSYYRTLVINEAGLPDEARFNAIEKSRNHVAEILNEQFGDGGYTSNEALTALGVYTVDDQDNLIPRFPEELVPPSTIELWDTYIAAVIAHEQARFSLEQKKMGSDQSAVDIADKTRTYAHDAIKKEFHAILNLQSTNSWDSKDTRRLLGDIRNQVLPTYASLISNESLEFMQNHKPSLIASQKLSSNNISK